MILSAAIRKEMGEVESRMRVEFFMPMKPPTATYQEKQVRVVKGKPVFYDPPEVTTARFKLTAHLAGHKPAHPLEGAVRLLVKWCTAPSSG